MDFSCVYRIECIDTDVKEIYIGSTFNLNMRIIKHKNTYKKYNFKVYKFIRENGGWDNFNIVVEVKTPNHNKEELVELEQIYLDLLEPELNSKNASGVEKKKKIEYQKEYGQTDKIKEYRKEYEKSDKRRINKKEYNRIKANCPKCDKEILKRCINRHLKICKD